MRTRTLAALLASSLFASGAAFAADPPASASSAPGAALAPATAGTGLAVLAVGDATSAAWPLARALYADGALRPAGLDEAHARVLAGEAPAPDAPKELEELAETRAAIKGDDAPSRRLLSSLAATFHVRGLVAVMLPTGATAQARVFLADSASFDAARYAPEPLPRPTADAAPREPEWTGAVASLSRTYGAPPQARPLTPSSMPAPAGALAPIPAADTAKEGAKEGDRGSGSRPFYTSAWFWGAIGAAVFGGTALYFATRDSGSETIHLQLQVPK